MRKAEACGLLLALLAILSVLFVNVPIRSVASGGLLKAEFRVETVELSVEFVEYSGNTYLHFPGLSDASPMGMAYDSLRNRVWMALHENVSILRIDNPPSFQALGQPCTSFPATSAKDFWDLDRGRCLC